MTDYVFLCIGALIELMVFIVQSILLDLCRFDACWFDETEVVRPGYCGQ